jgi:transcriptional regulator with XRE-family HTH domain
MRRASLKVPGALAAAIARTGVTQSELARRLTGLGFQTHPSTINRYTKGSVVPSVDILAGMAECMKISADELLGLRAVEAPKKPERPPIDEDVKWAAKVSTLKDGEVDRLATMQRAAGNPSRSRLLSYASDIIDARSDQGGGTDESKTTTTRIKSVSRDPR